MLESCFEQKYIKFLYSNISFALFIQASFFPLSTLYSPGGEFPKKFSEIEDFKEFVAQGSPELSKRLSCLFCSTRDFPQIALYSHSSSTPPNKSPLTALEVIKAPEPVLLGGWFMSGHAASPGKPNHFKSGPQCRSYTLPSLSITLPPR